MKFAGLPAVTLHCSSLGVSGCEGFAELPHKTSHFYAHSSQYVDILEGSHCLCHDTQEEAVIGVSLGDSGTPARGLRGVGCVGGCDSCGQA